jgi:hypothetical protein
VLFLVGDTEAFFTVVVVTAGWVEVPAELELAAAELVDEIAACAATSCAYMAWIAAW